MTREKLIELSWMLKHWQKEHEGDIVTITQMVIQTIEEEITDLEGL